MKKIIALVFIRLDGPGLFLWLDQAESKEEAYLLAQKEFEAKGIDTKTLGLVIEKVMEPGEKDRSKSPEIKEYAEWKKQVGSKEAQPKEKGKTIPKRGKVHQDAQKEAGEEAQKKTRRPRQEGAGEKGRRASASLDSENDPAGQKRKARDSAGKARGSRKGKGDIRS